MPRRPAKSCAYPGCNVLIRQARTAEKHAVFARSSGRSTCRPFTLATTSVGMNPMGSTRPSAGSGSPLDIDRLHPICEEVTKPSQITDHIKARKTHPELSLVWSNLRALCRRVPQPRRRALDGSRTVRILAPRGCPELVH